MQTFNFGELARFLHLGLDLRMINILKRNLFLLFFSSFVIYSFLSLCYDYLGGEIRGSPSSEMCLSSSCRIQNEAAQPSVVLQVLLYVRKVLSERKGRLHRVVALLEASYSAVLRGQTAHGCHHRRPAGLRQIQGWRLQVSFLVLME